MSNFWGAYQAADYNVDNVVATETPANERVKALIENIKVNYNIDAVALATTDADESIVTVTFDVTNKSSRAENFNIYAIAYKDEGVLYSAQTVRRLIMSGETQQLLFKINVPKNDKDTFGKIFVWDDNMTPSSEAATFQISNHSSGILNDIVINEDMTLYADASYNNVTLNGGKLDLNGHKLYVNGELLQPSGEVFVNGGKLEIEGDYRLQRQYEETNQYGGKSTQYSVSSGILNMTNESDKVLVNGDFYTESYIEHSQYLQAGIMELKGDFNQIGNGNYYYEYYGVLNNFDASKNHKVIFSGTKEQNISFESLSSGFANAEFKNENIVIDTDLKGWVMTGDLTVSGDCKVGLGCGTALDLNGHQLHIKGNYSQPDGEIKINGGSLVVDGNYRLQH